MVFGVCRRLLQHEHDAEDAFQATFLVLMRRAQSLTQPELLANWLYGVAYRTARKLQSANTRQRAREAPMIDLPAPKTDHEGIWRELRTVLDDELERLPPRYRSPLVLFYLEGKTTEEVASVLGCPKGTILSRLARGRERLRARLARRKLVLPAGVLAPLLARIPSSDGTVPEALLAWSRRVVSQEEMAQGSDGLAPRARQVAEQVLKDMTWSRLNKRVVLLLAGLLSLGVGILAYRALSPLPAALEPRDFRSDMDKLQGAWQVVAVESDGQVVPAALFPFTTLTIRGDTILHQGGVHDMKVTFQLDPSQRPKAIEMQDHGYHSAAYHAIYTLDGDTLTICRSDDSDRPAEFVSKPGSRVLLMTAKRITP
jgi:RNA polymerase sigma factor (sigma-70 family)